MKAIFGVAMALVLIGAGWLAFKGTMSEKDATPAAKDATVSVDTAVAGKETYTMEEVATHKDVSSCLTVIRGEVYDVTAFIKKHPGGDRNILKLCGLDGTAAFEGKHGGQEKPENALKGFEVGTLVR